MRATLLPIEGAGKATAAARVSGLQPSSPRHPLGRFFRLMPELEIPPPPGRCQQHRHAVAGGVLRRPTQHYPQRGRDRACWHTPRTYAPARGEVATAFPVRRRAGAPPFTCSSSGRAKKGFPQRVRARLWQNEVRKLIRTTAQPFPRCVVCHPRYPRTTCYSAFCVPIGGTNSRTYRA